MAAPSAARVARQHLETTRLLGVDFIPRAAAHAAEPSPTTAADAADPERARRAAMLDELRARHDAECPHCTNAAAHTRTVFGEGDPCAELMFVGEAPGAEEDRTGRPFVGRAGQKLDDMIAAIGLRREDVYIANVLKARPPNNATPTHDEAARCGPYLAQQIAVIKPKVIVTLGKPAANFLLDNRESMGSMRGRWHEYTVPKTGESIPVMPTFHPAFLLRQYTLENRKLVWSDLQTALKKIRKSAT